MAGMKNAGRSGAWLLSSIVAAIAASLCCVLPIAFAILGVSVVGLSTALAAWRPVLLGATSVLLVVGFYFAYRPAKVACAPDGACAAPGAKRRGRTALWVATGLVIAFAAFPYYSGPVAMSLLPGASAAAVQPTGTITESRLAIEGMDCSACAVAITNNLKTTPGVVSAEVFYPAGRAIVRYRAGAVSVAQLEQAVAAAGYRSHPL